MSFLKKLFQPQLPLPQGDSLAIYKQLVKERNARDEVAYEDYITCTYGVDVMMSAEHRALIAERKQTEKIYRDFFAVLPSLAYKLNSLFHDAASLEVISLQGSFEENIMNATYAHNIKWCAEGLAVDIQHLVNLTDKEYKYHPDSQYIKHSLSLVIKGR